MKDNELIHCIENIAVSWVNPFVDGIITAKEDARVQEQLDFIQEVLVMSVTCPLPCPLPSTLPSTVKIDSLRKN